MPGDCCRKTTSQRVGQRETVNSFMISMASSLLQLFCLADVRASLGTRLETWTAAHCLASSPRPGPLTIPLTAHPCCGNSYNGVRGQSVSGWNNSGTWCWGQGVSDWLRFPMILCSDICLSAEGVTGHDDCHGRAGGQAWGKVSPEAGCSSRQSLPNKCKALGSTHSAIE